MQKFPHGRNYVDEKLCAVQVQQKGIQKNRFCMIRLLRVNHKVKFVYTKHIPAMNTLKIYFVSTVHRVTLASGNFDLTKRRF